MGPKIATYYLHWAVLSPGDSNQLRIDAYLRPEAFLGDLGVDESLMSDEFWHTLREAGLADSPKGSR